MEIEQRDKGVLLVANPVSMGLVVGATVFCLLSMISSVFLGFMLVLAVSYWGSYKIQPDMTSKLYFFVGYLIAIRACYFGIQEAFDGALSIAMNPLVLIISVFFLSYAQSLFNKMIFNPAGKTFEK